MKGFVWSRPLKLKQRLQPGLGTGDGDGCKTKDGDGDGDGDDGDGDGCITFPICVLLCSFVRFCPRLLSLLFSCRSDYYSFLCMIGDMSF